MKNHITLVYGFILLASLSTPAYAYLDPGTGSMIIQGLIAGLAMAAVTIKMYWHKLISFFYMLFGKKKKDDTDTD